MNDIRWRQSSLLAKYLKDVAIGHFRMDQSNRFLVLLLSVVVVALWSEVIVQNVLVQDLVDRRVLMLVPLIDRQMSKNAA